MTSSSNLILTVFLCLTSVLANAYPRQVQGRVFADKNANGIWDKGEKLIHNAGVSDGRQVVWTDKKGRYSITTEAGLVFPVIPDGWMSASGSLQNDCTLRLSEHSGNQSDLPIVLQHDFPLFPIENSSRKSFRVAVVGDVQVDSKDEVELAKNSVLRELASREDLDFVIHMGDLVNDKPSLFSEILPSWKALGHPTWFVAGNHDMDTLDRSHRAASNFRKLVGNDVGAWFRGETCFIMLDNVEFADYRIPESQLEFVRNIMVKCSEDKLIVLLMHVPLDATKNREELLGLLGSRRTLVLSAHAHNVFRKEWSETISEVSVGASCGSWWTGERDMWNIPIALQQCGSPRNYFVFDFNANDFVFSFKGVGLDSSIQADAAFVEDKVLVNVYGGGEATSVEFSVDGREWWPMVRKNQVAPYVLRMVRMNKEGGYPTTFSRKTPLRNRKASPHIWEAGLPIEKEERYQFRVTDSKGLKPFTFSAYN